MFVIGGKWKPLIVFHLTQSTLRYGGLRRAVGKVSHKVLIQQLKELQSDGIIERLDHGEIPPRVDYSLTPFGQSLADALFQLCTWGSAHADRLSDIVARREKVASHETSTAAGPG
ncbi:winged helix-turn-helix transcriptional regulator [Sphingobium phenoxybenzoativorans]|uniref:winged helix-turn-helix transcriptional regulator n=1 Tax=Sphingobium phenoxybenzoativorans TaxID=1592790 RepID=UPI00209AD056|nr:helix-turn-helix domain-containing protein [Sphingobium phenoxybenzoativorans]